jgi:hypothetical protein
MIARLWNYGDDDCEWLLDSEQSGLWMWCGCDNGGCVNNGDWANDVNKDCCGTVNDPSVSRCKLLVAQRIDDWNDGEYNGPLEPHRPELSLIVKLLQIFTRNGQFGEQLLLSAMCLQEMCTLDIACVASKLWWLNVRNIGNLACLIASWLSRPPERGTCFTEREWSLNASDHLPISSSNFSINSQTSPKS